MCLCSSVILLHLLRSKERPNGMFCGEWGSYLGCACPPLPAQAWCVSMNVTTTMFISLPAGCSSLWYSPANVSFSLDLQRTFAASGSHPDCPLSLRLLGLVLVALALVWALDWLLCSLHWLQKWALHGRGWLSWCGWQEGTADGTPSGSASSCWSPQGLTGYGSGGAWPWPSWKSS